MRNFEKMGFLKKERAPDELPDLAIDNNTSRSNIPQISDVPKNIVATIGPPAGTQEESSKNEENNEDNSLEFSEDQHNKTLSIEKKIEEIDRPAKELEYHDGIPEDITKPKFFDKILNDINGGIEDVGKLEDWYENKFSSQDIVSNMKGYWEGNKADIIIQSFGAEYKKKINENIKELQRLEEDWRGVYFNLIKKEEEMKKVEQQLKSTLAEFVNLCKRRRNEEDKSED